MYKNIYRNYRKIHIVPTRKSTRKSTRKNYQDNAV